MMEREGVRSTLVLVKTDLGSMTHLSLNMLMKGLCLALLCAGANEKHYVYCVVCAGDKNNITLTVFSVQGTNKNVTFAVISPLGTNNNILQCFPRRGQTHFRFTVFSVPGTNTHYVYCVFCTGDEQIITFTVFSVPGTNKNNTMIVCACWGHKKHYVFVFVFVSVTKDVPKHLSPPFMH